MRVSLGISARQSADIYTLNSIFIDRLGECLGHILPLDFRHPTCGLCIGDRHGWQ
jgi:hypothetical protein